MTTNWKANDQDAVTALQRWYGSNSTGLYTWEGSDADVIKDAPISNGGFDLAGNHYDVVGVIQMVGLWDTLRDTVRWWNSANAITALIDYMLVTGDRSYLSVVENTFNNGPKTWKPKPNLSAGDWIRAATHAAVQWLANQANPGGLVPGGADPGQVFIGDIAVYYSDFLNNFHDDEGWWALAWIKAYDLTSDKKYLTQAETIFNDMYGGSDVNAGWDNYCNGGIYWQKNKQGTDGKTPYKNAIANELLLAVSSGLYVRLAVNPDKKIYLDRANAAWVWFENSGLINAAHLINDSFGKNPAGWSCNNDQSMDVWTYNQGVILGALCGLFVANQTQLISNRQPQLLDTAQDIADALISNPVKPKQANSSAPGLSGVNAQGILAEYSDSDLTAGVDTKQFKGIFVRNLGYLYKYRPLARYRAFILKNANSALSNAKNGSNQFGGNWSGPFDSADFVRQTSAVDLLNAAASIPPEINYNSLRAFVLASGIPFPASVSNILNGAGSLRSVLLN